MARPLRIEFAGAVYHVTNRGNRREPIFDGDGDRECFLSVLESVLGRFKWLCHAYCLMDNHYHLLVETLEPNLSRGMRQLNGVYTQRHNAAHGKVGHLFQGRFKAVLVEKESHLLEVTRYVVLNPVRAGMVDGPREWRWSSYRASAGLRRPPSLLTVDWLLTQFGKRRGDAQRAYRHFVREGKGAASPFAGLAGGCLLGSDEFVAMCRGFLTDDQTLEEVPRRERYAGRPSLEVLFGGVGAGKSAARNEAIGKAHIDYGYTQKVIGDFCGLHYSAVSRIVKESSSGAVNARFKT